MTLLVASHCCCCTIVVFPIERTIKFTKRKKRAHFQINSIQFNIWKENRKIIRKNKVQPSINWNHSIFYIFNFNWFYYYYFQINKIHVVVFDLFFFLFMFSVIVNYSIKCNAYHSNGNLFLNFIHFHYRTTREGSQLQDQPWPAVYVYQYNMVNWIYWQDARIHTPSKDNGDFHNLCV